MENNIENKPSVSPAPKVESKWKKHARDAWDLVKFAIIALAIVVPIRMFIAQPFVVSGDSMFPTFHNGEYLIVDEISYILGTPKRGDVVIFKYPNDPSRYFIKRIIGLPNEEVNIKNGEITIKNKENPDGFKLAEPYINEKFSTTEVQKIGDEEYFVMGDNRNRSSDSRVWGLLPRKNMTGRAFLRLLPLGSISYLPGYYQEAK